MKKKRYTQKYRLSSEEYSSNDLQKLANNIQSYLEWRTFCTQIVPMSVVVLIVIMYFVLR